MAPPAAMTDVFSLYDADEFADCSGTARPIMLPREDADFLEFARACTVPAPIQPQPLMKEFRP